MLRTWVASINYLAILALGFARSPQCFVGLLSERSRVVCVVSRVKWNEWNLVSYLYLLSWVWKWSYMKQTKQQMPKINKINKCYDLVSYLDMQSTKQQTPTIKKNRMQIGMRNENPILNMFLKHFSNFHKVLIDFRQCHFSWPV